MRKKKESLYEKNSKDFMITDSLKRQNKIEDFELKNLGGVDLLFNENINKMIKNPRKKSKKKDKNKIREFDK